MNKIANSVDWVLENSKCNKEYLPNRSYANNSKVDNVLQFSIIIVDFLNTT